MVSIFSHNPYAATESTRLKNLTSLQCYNQIVDGTKIFLIWQLVLARIVFYISSVIYGSQPQVGAFTEGWLGVVRVLQINTLVAKLCAAEHLCALVVEPAGVWRAVSLL